MTTPNPTHSSHLSVSSASLPTPNSTFELASLIANLAEAKKSVNTAILDVEYISGFADFFVIATAQSTTQIKAICQHIIKSLRDLNLEPIGQEDDATSGWNLIDFGDVVVHVMREDVREHYDLESFWSHGRRVPRDDWSADDALPTTTNQGSPDRKFA